MPMPMAMTGPVRWNIARWPLQAWLCRTWEASAWAISPLFWAHRRLQTPVEPMAAWQRREQARIAPPAIGTSPACCLNTLYRPNHIRFLPTPDPRRDSALAPLATTLLALLKASGKEVIGIGKIEDLFAGRGLTQRDHTEPNRDGMAATLSWLERDFTGLLFVNLVEFDMLWGHRRDSQGYAQALRDVDAWFGRGQQVMQPGDAIFFTADYGVDPTCRGTAHTGKADRPRAYGK